MLQKWKFILTNWINCYFNESGKQEQCVTTESLLSIISHLRDNLNLNESKSSILEAHTIAEFICDKYPEFKFENGTLEASNEEDVYIAASLLLYFVCVNSKDVDMKSAMCSKLGRDDQETILKFSRSLMECSAITCSSVQAAIIESCGLDTASPAVAETPPALRSLHGEVRRLQAALDAERFDRGYLQDELARTSLRLDQLLKDKEQHKLEIMNLKAKISICCGQESEPCGGVAAGDTSARLARQLEESEQRLVDTQGKLDDAQFERDTYKAKVEELKQQRESLLTAHEESSTLASQLSNDLEAERRHSHALRELVCELRSHQQRIRLDGSQLECDDPDASLHSLHNASICSEACANVVEVQLGEERATNNLLHQQLQALRDQLTELTQKMERERQTLEKIISDNEDDIFNLKHRVNEEIEEKSNLKSLYNEKLITLNNDINELEQKLKDSNEHSRVVIEQKIHEVQTLQDEKLSLIQSLSDETSKLEAVIKELRTDLDTEKTLKLKMKDDYENHMMKLNEKVLNRNNELVELQNNVLEKSEMIERLHLDLRKEREATEDLANKYHSDIAQLNHDRRIVEQELQQKTDEAKELQKRLQQNVSVFEELNKEIDDLNAANANLSKDLDEKHATVNSLQIQLQDEINYKTRLQNELTQAATNLSEEINKLKTDIHDKDRIIYAIDLYLKEEKHANKTLKEDCDKVNEELKKQLEEVSENKKEIETLKCKLETEGKLFEEELRIRDDLLEAANGKLSTEVSQKSSLQSMLSSLEGKKCSLDKDLSQKNDEILQLQAEYAQLKEVTEKNINLIDSLEKRLGVENEKYSELQNNFVTQTSDLIAKLNETDKTVNEYRTKYKHAMEEKELQLQTRKIEIEKMQKIVENYGNNTEKLEKENDVLTENLNEQISYRNKFEKEYQNQAVVLNNVTTELNEKLVEQNEEISALKKEIVSLSEVQDHCTLLTNLTSQLKEEISLKNQEMVQKNEEISALKKEIVSLCEVTDQCTLLTNCTSQLNDEITLKNEEIMQKNEEISALKKEIASLCEVTDQCSLLNNLTSQLKDEITLKNEEIMQKNEEISALKKEIVSFSEVQDQCTLFTNLTSQLKEEITMKNDEIVQKNEELSLLRKEIVSLSEVQKQCTLLTNLTSQLKEEITMKNEEIVALKKDVELFSKVVDEKTEEIRLLQDKLLQETQEITVKKDLEADVLKKKIANLTSLSHGLELEFRKKIDIEMQAVSVLKRENEQLHCTVEEDSISRELLMKKKDLVIERLEEQLEDASVQLDSIRKDYEEATLMWERYKVEMQQSLEGKCKEITILEAEVTELKNNLEDNMIASAEHEEELKRQFDDFIINTNNTNLMNKTHIDSLMAEVSLFQTQLDDSKRANEALSIELENEKASRDILETEKTELSSLNAAMVLDLFQKKTEHSTLNEENKVLMNEKLILTQELMEERSARRIVEQEKLDLISENDKICQQLNEELILKNTILEEKEQLNIEFVESVQILKDKERIIEQLNEEILDKNNLESENLSLQAQLVNKTVTSEQEKISYMTATVFANKKLLDEIGSLNEQLTSLTLANDLLKNNMAEVEAVRFQIFNEKECILDENDSLKHGIMELKAIQDSLIIDKEAINVEKETLVTDLNEEKAVRDEIETEKNSISEKLRKCQEQYAIDLNDKQKQLDTISAELHNLRLDLKKHEEISLQFSLVLNTGLEKTLQNLKKEEITNDVLQKHLTDETEEMSVKDKCDLLIKIVDTLTTELSLRVNMGKALENENLALKEMREMVKQKEMQVHELQNQTKRLEQIIHVNKVELSKLADSLKTTVETNDRDVQRLQLENRTLHNELNDVKIQLEVKVHSLKEKLTDNENLTDKLKQAYECQIDNLNLMVTKISGYLKDKTVELEAARKEKDRVQQTVDDSCRVIKTLEEEVKSQRQNQEKLIGDFESERLVLKNMVTVTESVMEDQKTSLQTIINEHLKDKEVLQEENKALQRLIDTERTDADLKLQEKDAAFEIVFRDITELRNTKENLEKDLIMAKDELRNVKESLETDLEMAKNELGNMKERLEEDLEMAKAELRNVKESLEKDLEMAKNELGNMKERLEKDLEMAKDELRNMKESLEKDLEMANESFNKEVITMKEDLENKVLYIHSLEAEKKDLADTVMKYKEVIDNLEQLIQHELQENKQLREDMIDERLVLENKCSLLKECHLKAAKEIETQGNELTIQKENNQTIQINLAKYWTSVIEAYQSNAKELEGACDALKLKLDDCEKDLKDKSDVIRRMLDEKVAISQQLAEEKAAKEKYQSELVLKAATVYELKQQIEEVKKREADVLESLRKDNEEMMIAVAQREAITSNEKLSNHKHSYELHPRDPHQVSTPTSDLTHSSIESLKTISDLETIIHDRNRTITTLQTDITYLKSLMAESENKLLDVNKELEVSKENCQQLSVQLKKIVHQKNDEIAELKKQVNKMSVTETRASQIIKVSARYQAMILKRIAEIKSNTILKELTNFGNTANCDNEFRRSLNSGAITMEDLENFLETTDRHLKRCSEKQITLQKERDRLTEVNKINESEILNLKKFLTELSISFKTFSSVKELYTQKLSKVVSIQRTVRREILNLDGAITDATMCKLERCYAAMMQDLSECVMNLERWVERSIARTISPEKIKQAFSSDDDRTSLASTTFQNAGLEVQLEELENGFHKLLDEISRAQKGEGAKDAQAVTVMEVRAEYEDKLNRMKAKMKQLYQEQIGVFKDKQREQIAMLERELEVAKEKLAETSRGYEEHIRALTTELWSVGEKFLMQKDEAEWLRKRQRSGSLMSLQHVHSAGLAPPMEEPPRPSDSHSLRSLPVHTNTNTHRTREKQGRGLHMSDEEGEVFDNRCLKELSATPRRESSAPAPGQRLSELRWRNSLCPPHLKSSYPAETQFTGAVDEDDIKCAATNGSKPQRKEVGITAYKKPGPPTPSKQAGRLSATDSELRESLRVEAEPQAARKTSTPSRIRALFRSSRSDAVDGTPRSRRLSNIFRKK